jgi:hypothetical protein
MHAASHMCMAVLAGSANDCNGEFPADLDEAGRHLDAVQELIQRAIST